VIGLLEIVANRSLAGAVREEDEVGFLAGFETARLPTNANQLYDFDELAAVDIASASTLRWLVEVFLEDWK